MPVFAIVARLVRKTGRGRELTLIAVALLIVIIGAMLFSLAEHVSYGTAVYWAVTTATTVGYGDVTPHNTAGRVIAAGVMLTTIPIVGAVFALFAGASALARIRRILGMDTHLPQQPYALVYGSHPILPRVLEELERAGDPVVLVAPSLPAGVSEDIELIAGDPTDDATVERSAPAQANRALIACTDDADTLVVAVALHALAPQLEVYALTQSPRVGRALKELGVTHTLASDELVGHTVAKSLETPQAGDLLLQLVDTESYRLTEQPIDQTLASRPLSDARATAGVLVLGIARDGHVDLGVGDDPILAAGDRLIVLEGARARLSARAPGSCKPVATLSLTFDDGPDPRWTPRLLDLLAASGARATFFPIASRAAAHGELIARTLDEGHAVGLHCDQHVRHSARDRDWLRRDRDRATELLSAVGVRPALWRTPWGDLARWSEQVAAERGLRIVGWTVDTHDWRGDGGQEIFARVKPALSDRAVVLAHDGIGPGARRSTIAETIEFVRRVVQYAGECGIGLAALS